MYLPYLRGKLMELTALYELNDLDKLSDQILPIIEPIKFSRDLKRVVEQFEEEKKNIIIIHNPQVGNFINSIDEEEKLEFEDYLSATCC